MRYKAIIALTNRNSSDFIELSKLSLYTAILTARATESAKTAVILLDDASNDDSFNKLSSFGEILSKKLNVEFYAYRLAKPRGHPYLLYNAYMLALLRFQADFLFKIDNDFIIVDFKILDKLINTINILKEKKVLLFSVAPMTLTCPRSCFYIYKTNIKQIIKEGKCILGGINKATRIGAIFREDFDSSFHSASERLLPTLFTYSSAFMIAVNNISKYIKNPFFPFFIRVYFDDAFAGIIMARMGFPSFLYMELGGIHYSGTLRKISSETLYCFFYNLSLLRSLLYGFKSAITLLIVATLASLTLKSSALKSIISVLEKSKRISLSSIEKHIIEIKKDNHDTLSKIIITATLKGLLNSRKYKRIIKNVCGINYQELKVLSEYEKYLPCLPIKNFKDILCILLSLLHVV
jgi:hypothetical protein